MSQTVLPQQYSEKSGIYFMSQKQNDTITKWTSSIKSYPNHLASQAL